MSSTTTNLGLTKTTAAETIGQTWAASNESGGNFDIIDTKMGAVGDTSLQAQVTALNSKITNPSSVSYATITANNQADFEAGLTNALNGMGVPNVRVCPCYANYSGSVTNGGQGIAFFSKISTSMWYVFIMTISSIKAGYYTNGTWTWL